MDCLQNHKGVCMRCMYDAQSPLNKYIICHMIDYLQKPQMHGMYVWSSISLNSTQCHMIDYLQIPWMGVYIAMKFKVIYYQN